MKKLIPLACLFLSGFSCADELLRFSEVFPIPGENIEPFTLHDAYGNEVLHVGKRVLIGDADVLAITPTPGPNAEEMRAVTIKFNKEGAKKFAEVTRRITGGRLAAIVNGKIVSAPVIREPILRGDAGIAGLDEETARQLYDAFQAKSGGLPWPKDKPFWRDTPLAETIPYTDEEYQELKKQRKGMGISFLDSLPAREELAKNLRVGMDYEAVLKLYGKPTFQEGDSTDAHVRSFWTLAPEKREPNRKVELVPVGFNVKFVNGQITGWEQTLLAITRTEKRVGLEPGTLDATFPVLDITNGEVDMLSIIEAVKIPNPAQPVNKRDLDDLLSWLMNLPTAVPGDKPGPVRINANCDFIKTLAHNFPEVAAEVKKAEDGKVDVGKLMSAVEPYLSGEKPLIPPERTAPK